MPAAAPVTERDILIAKRKRLEEEAKAFPSNPAAQNEDNISTGAIQKRLQRFAKDIEEIDARLQVLTAEAKKK